MGSASRLPLVLTLAVDTALAIATTHALAFLKLPSTSPTSMVSPSRWNGLVPTVLAVLAPVASPGRGQLMVSVTRKLGRAPTRTWSAATNKSVNAVIRVFAIALLDSVLVSLATLVLRASALLALTTALVTELAVPTGTLPTTGQLPRLPRSNPTIQETDSLSCSRKLTSLPTMTHGTLTCTTVASAMRATVVQVALWWSAPRRLIPLMTSALPLPQSRTTSCNTTLPSEVQAGNRLTPTEKARQSQMTNKRTCPRVTTTVSTFWIPMAARF